MAKSKVYIYGIYDSITNELKYIGKANNVSKRFKSHIRDSKHRHTPICNWLSKKILIGQLPYIKVIKETDNENWQEEEKKQIAYYRNAGFNLLNIAIGGNQPKVKTINNSQINKINEKRKIDSTYNKMHILKQKLQIVLRIIEKTGNTTKRAEINKRLLERGIYV